MIIVIGIRASDPCALNKGRGSKFHVGSWVWQETPEEDQRTYRLKHCEYSNKDDVNILKILNDKDSFCFNPFSDVFFENEFWGKITSYDIALRMIEKKKTEETLMLIYYPFMNKYIFLIQSIGYTSPTSKFHKFENLLFWSDHQCGWTAWNPMTLLPFITLGKSSRRT